MQIITLSAIAFITSYNSAYTIINGRSFRSGTKRRMASSGAGGGGLFQV